MTAPLPRRSDLLFEGQATTNGSGTWISPWIDTQGAYRVLVRAAPVLFSGTPAQAPIYQIDEIVPMTVGYGTVVQWRAPALTSDVGGSLVDYTFVPSSRYFFLDFSDLEPSMTFPVSVRAISEVGLNGLV